MSWLTRDDVKGLVEEALREAADFSGDIEGYQMSELSEQHQVVFMGAIATRLKKKGFEVPLSLGKLQGFATIGDLINYVEENQSALV